MPTPREEFGSLFIEISDFSPGIHSEQYGSDTPVFTADPALKGTLLGNGLARVDGTERCHADKTGALVPLPKAQPTGVRDTITPSTFSATTPPYRYVLDAQIGATLVDGSEIEATAFPEKNRTLYQVMWGYWLNFGSGPAPTVVGREYRSWVDFPDGYDPGLPVVDFMFCFADDSPEDGSLPAGSLCRARFDYGRTANGVAEATAGTTGIPAGSEDVYHPLWMYPVSVAVAATPWVRWGAGNRWARSAVGPGVASFMGLALDLLDPIAETPPAIGWVGYGTALIAMQLNDNGVLDMPFPSPVDRWFYHYSERYNSPLTDLIANIANGPLNPYMVVAHQGRIVMPDRRRSAGGLATTSFEMNHGFIDDLLFYSDVHLPTQDFVDPPLASQDGTANAAVGDWPEATMEPYNKLLVAEDIISDVGTLGVVTIDQLLVVKHRDGGALVSGDLDNPTIQRFPYIESTGGVICKGVHCSIGFVYGSRNGIFVWNGGASTEKLSPQLDGFFWNHTDGSDAETYAGSRGRMTDWNEFVLVPNNYLYDIERQSWWRFAMQTLEPVAAVDAPYNCYDVDESDILYAWPYRHRTPVIPSGAIFPASTTELNCLSIPDPLGAVTELDIRFCIRTGGTGERTIISHWQTSGNQRAWAVQFNASEELEFMTSTDGAAGTVLTATCSAIFDSFDSTALILGRVTWRSSDGRVQFFKKAIGSIKAEMQYDFGWTQIGTDEVAATAALHNSTEALVIGNLGDNALSEPFVGRIFAASVASTIAGAPLFETYPEDFPQDTTDTSWPATSGQTITFTKAATPPSASFVWVDSEVPPVWYTFDRDVLDEQYSWQSHPLVESRDRVLTFQSLDLLCVGQNTSGSPATITITLTGLDETGATTVTRTVVFTLALGTQLQLLRKDFENFHAQYVTVKIAALSPTDGVPAPKIQSIRLAYKPRATTPRAG